MLQRTWRRHHCVVKNATARTILLALILCYPLLFFLYPRTRIYLLVLFCLFSSVSFPLGDAMSSLFISFSSLLLSLFSCGFVSFNFFSPCSLVFNCFLLCFFFFFLVLKNLLHLFLGFRFFSFLLFFFCSFVFLDRFSCFSFSSVSFLYFLHLFPFVFLVIFSFASIVDSLFRFASVCDNSCVYFFYVSVSF